MCNISLLFTLYNTNQLQYILNKCMLGVFTDDARTSLTYIEVRYILKWIVYYELTCKTTTSISI